MFVEAVLQLTIGPDLVQHEVAGRPSVCESHPIGDKLLEEIHSLCKNA
jgi:hypothetical protein